MRLTDLSRVLKGASLVIDQVVKRNRPEIAWRLERAKFHAGELLKVLIEVNNENKGSRVDYEDYSHKDVHNSGARDGSDVPDATKTPEKPKAQVVVDPIGFSTINVDSLSEDPMNNVQARSDSNKKQMNERAVPSTQLGRMMGFGSLAFRMAMGEAVDRASHAISGNSGPRSISDENAERLAESLCRMRGAALKLGQVLSLQDDSSLPPSLSKALERVKQAADYMPKRQLEAQLEDQLGADWRSKLLDFDPVPLAAASIGQVHRATLLDGTEVAMKIQYPGVAESIDSDLMNLKRLVQMTNLLPPGLFIDKIIEVASVELKEECDYIREAASQEEYRRYVIADPVLSRHCQVPQVYPELCTKRILTTKLVPGYPIDQAVTLPQEVRNAIARAVLIITIRELFEWRFIQSDPNYANFLYDHPGKTIYIIDFGAARRYNKSFVDGYMKLVWAASNKDVDTILKVSKDLGFITGDETQEFMDAHVAAGLVVGEPFLLDAPFDFGNS
eukprot:gene17684-20142_t